MILNYKFTASNGKVIEGMRTEFDRDYRDEGTAIFFIDNDENPDGYYEFNLMKDDDGKLMAEAYVAEYPDSDAVNPDNLIEDVEVQLVLHDFDNTLKLANALLYTYQLVIVLDYEPESDLWSIGYEHFGKDDLQYDSNANRAEELDDMIRELALRLESDAIAERKKNALYAVSYVGLSDNDYDANGYSEVAIYPDMDAAKAKLKQWRENEIAELKQNDMDYELLEDTPEKCRISWYGNGEQVRIEIHEVQMGI